MRRLLLLSILSITVAATVGCQSGQQWLSRCRCFSGYRGAPCNVCAPAPCACPSPCATPVYSQSLPVYGGEMGCSDCSSCGSFGGFPGGCAGGCGGTEFAPGTMIPGQGVIIDGGQIPSLPGGSLAPQTVPAPQTTPIPQATPGPAGGS